MSEQPGPRAGAAVIELYCGDPPTLRYETSLAQMVAAGLRINAPQLLTVEGLRIDARLRHGEDPGAEARHPGVTNLAPELGVVELTGHRLGETVWQTQFPVSELFGALLSRLAQRLGPGEPNWAFRIAGRPGTPLPRSASAVSGAQQAPFRPRLDLAIRPLEEPLPPVVDPTRLDLTPPGGGEVAVVYTEGAHVTLTRALAFSDLHEDGGFLEGTVSRSGPAGGHIVRIDTVHPAQYGRSSAVEFTFTSDSFSAISRRLAERPGQLVGWYHTHLFSPNTMGLSIIDVSTHLATFHQPWQIAALVNVTPHGRTLRTYARSGDTMKECEQWIADERGRHSRAGAHLGDEGKQRR